MALLQPAAVQVPTATFIGGGNVFVATTATVLTAIGSFGGTLSQSL